MQKSGSVSRRPMTVLLALLTAFLLAGCPSDPGAKDAQSDPAAPGQAEQKADEAAAAKSEEKAPDPLQTDLLAGSHILIPYKGAMRADAAITRTKEEAKKLAEDLLAKLKKKPGDFETLAKENSSCPSAQNGGDLGNWQKGRMVPEFDQAIGKLKVGEISPEVVETSFGFHVMRRNKAVPPQELSAQHILIAYKGAVHAKPEVTRTKEEAKALAEKAATEAKADTAKFTEIAEKYTDDKRFIKMPNWITGREMPKAFDEAVTGVKIGEVAGPVETEFGYHVFLRTEVVKPPVFSGAHILIAYKGALRAASDVTRTKEEALELAKVVLGKAQADPSKFKDLATMYSNDPTVKMNGGDLGQWPKGRMVPAFDQAIENMEIGKVGGPIETDYGYHVLLRKPLDDGNPPPAP